MKEEEFQKLLDAEAPLQLAANRNKAFLMSIVFLFILGFEFFLVHNLIAIFICAFFFIANLYALFFPKSRSLNLNFDNFVQKNLFLTKEYAWNKVTQFKAEKNGVVSFTKTLNDKPHNLSQLIRNRYGITTLQLAQLMNHW